MRVWCEGEMPVALLANGYEGGFSTCWPPASRLILDLFEEAWQTCAGTVEERLIAAFRVACAQFVQQSAGLVAPAEYVPGASLLAAAVDRGKTHVAWIGGGTAVIAGGLGVKVRTVPHTLREHFKRGQLGEAVDASLVPNVLVRGIGSEWPAEQGPEHATFGVESGETLMLLSRLGFRDTGVVTEDLANAAAAFTDPTLLAEFLAELSFKDAPYAAVAAVRFGGQRLG